MHANTSIRHAWIRCTSIQGDLALCSRITRQTRATCIQADLGTNCPIQAITATAQVDSALTVDALVAFKFKEEEKHLQSIHVSVLFEKRERHRYTPSILILQRPIKIVQCY